jgi:hypothetical protein
MAQQLQEKHCIQSWSKISEQLVHDVGTGSVDPLNCSLF